MNTKRLNFPAERFAFKYAGDEAEGIVDAIVNTTGLTSMLRSRGTLEAPYRAVQP